MKDIDDVLDAVKEITGSDYRTGVLLHVDRQRVSGWRARRSFPNNKHIMLMCDLGKLDLRAVLEAVEYSREHDRPMKEAGFATLGMMSGLGAMSLAIVSPLPYAGAIAAMSAGAMYIMLNDGTILCVSKDEFEAHLPSLKMDQLLHTLAANSAEIRKVATHRIN